MMRSGIARYRYAALAVGFVTWGVIGLALVGAAQAHASDDPTTCREQLARLDGLLQRAKLTPQVGIPMTKARAEAIAHRDAGRHKACSEAVAEAFRIMADARR